MISKTMEIMVFVEEKMNLTIRKWKINDKSNLAINLNNLKVLNNLRDGLSYPYTEKDAEDIIRIFAEPFAHIIASCRALEKAGFQH